MAHYYSGIAVKTTLRKCLLVALLSAWLSGCCATTPHSLGTDRISPALLLQSNHAHPKGVFIVIHGLNQEPSTMDPVAAYLTTLNFHVYRITLRGHREVSAQPFEAVSWETDVVQAYRAMRARYPALPIHLLGYSLGGMLATRVTDNYPEVQPQSMVLIAPALSLRLLVQTSFALNLLPPLTSAVPNIAPRYYRRFARTPLFWYQNTLSLYSLTRTISPHSKLRVTPTLVFANPVDELVSYSGLTSWIQDNGLASSWHTIPLRPHPRDPFTPAHLMIDERSLGETHWEELQSSMANFVR